MRKKQYTRFVGLMLSDAIYADLVAVTDELQLSISEYTRELVKKALVEFYRIKEDEKNDN